MNTFLIKIFVATHSFNHILIANILRVIILSIVERVLVKLCSVKQTHFTLNEICMLMHLVRTRFDMRPKFVLKVSSLKYLSV